jgi:hypothetical protein
MNLFHNATFDSASGWGLSDGVISDGVINDGVINVDNGFIDNPNPTPDIPAGISTIAGGQLTQSGGTINVLDADGTLQFNALFQTSGGSFVNNGRVIFNNNATISVAGRISRCPPRHRASLSALDERSVSPRRTSTSMERIR